MESKYNNDKIRSEYASIISELNADIERFKPIEKGSNNDLPDKYEL